MSHKNLDEKQRWRNVTVGFRVSKEESEDINMRVKLSGLTKQNYILRRLQDKSIVVVGNPRVHKALKDQLTAVLAELRRITQTSEMDELLTKTIHLIAVTVNGLKDKEEHYG